MYDIFEVCLKNTSIFRPKLPRKIHCGAESKLHEGKQLLKMIMPFWNRRPADTGACLLTATIRFLAAGSTSNDTHSLDGMWM